MVNGYNLFETASSDTLAPSVLLHCTEIERDCNAWIRQARTKD